MQVCKLYKRCWRKHLKNTERTSSRQRSNTFEGSLSGRGQGVNPIKLKYCKISEKMTILQQAWEAIQKKGWVYLSVT